MKKYSPAKGVGCDERRPGSNPGFSAKVPGMQGISSIPGFLSRKYRSEKMGQN